MSVNQLRGALRRAEEMFSAAGASRQAKALTEVDRVLSPAQGESVEQFVDSTRAALTAPALADETSAVVAERLAGVGTDQAIFSSLFEQLKAREFGRDKAIEVAALYTGAGEAMWGSKAKALEAIRLKFEERVYLASKAALNEKVTPW